MLLTSMDGYRYLTQTIPDEPEGKYIITDTTGTIPILCLSEANDGWHISTEKGCSFKHKPDFDILKNGSIFKIIYDDGNEEAEIFVEEQTRNRQRFSRFKIQSGFKFTVGSASDNAIVCQLPYVESHMFTMQCQSDGSWQLNLNSTEALLYVNGKRFHGGKLHHGDLLWFMGQKIVVMPHVIAINNPDEKTQINSSYIKPLDYPIIAAEKAYKPNSVVDYFNRSPRLAKSWKLDDITIDAPPGMAGTDQQNLLMSMAPALANGLLSLVAGFGSVFTIGNMVTNLAFPAISRRKMQQQKDDYAEKQKEAYKAYLNEIDKKINDKLADQSDYLKKMIPSAKEEIQKVFESKSYLWNRRNDQEDCFVVRLGTGDLPLKCKVTFPQEHFSVDDNPLKDMLDEFRKKELTVHHVPISIDLSKTRCCGISGDSVSRTEQLISIISQLCIHVGYDELKLWIIGELHDKARYISRLPHTWSNDRKTHYVIESADDYACLGQEINNELEKRILSSGDLSKQNLPFIVVIISDLELIRTGHLSRLLYDRKYDRICIIALNEHSRNLPRVCDSVMKVTSKRVVLLRDEEDRLDFTPDQFVSDNMENLSYTMENTVLYTDDTSESLPSIVPFLQLFNTSDADWLNIGKRWKTNDPSRSLRAPIGIDENGRICELDIHERINGPHGLVAGTTGSGKSELLMTYILSMAVCYSPEEVSFLLIDYKGGGMAETFQQLPHVAGIITNLEGANIDRALKSIRSELLKRQETFQKTQLLFNIPKMEITQYQQLYRNGKVKDPIPHLIIITDEFAELKAQQPDFMQELISVSNIGRSLGVHLILSTQKPSGVVDEKIRSNSKFKICLHVESASDSNDMIRCPDAATIYDVGRFYMDPGYGMLSLVQSGWTGAQYSPGHMEVSGAYVDVVDHTGKVVYHSTIETNSKNSVLTRSTQLDVIKERIINLAKVKKLNPRALWLPPLEEMISLHLLKDKYSNNVTPGKLSVILGEADDPENQARFPVVMDLNAGRHTIIYGMTDAGKDLALKTMLTDIILSYTPDDVWIYILDFAGEGLSDFTAAPHVGDVISASEDEKVYRLLDYLQKEISRRQIARSNAVVDSDRQTADSPDIIVVIHQLESFRKILEKTNQEDTFVSYLDNGPQYALYFVATAQSDSRVGYKIRDRFSQIVLLQMANENDYAVYPRIGKMRPAQVYGRGLFKNANGIYEFQTASLQEDIEQICGSAAKQWQGKISPALPVMPPTLTTMYIMQFAVKEELYKIPVGLDYSSLEPVYLDGTTKRVHQIIGQQEAIVQFAQSMAQIGKAMNFKVTVLDGYGNIPENTSAELLQKEQCSDFVEKYYFQRKEAQNKTNNKDAINQLVILVGMKRILDILSLRNMTVGDSSNDYASILEIILTKVNVKLDYQTLFIVCEEPRNIQSLKDREKKWYRNQIGDNDGIVLNGDLENSFTTVHSGKNRIHQKSRYPYGYIVSDGNAVYVKFAQFV